jgi:hypothetical protein
VVEVGTCFVAHALEHPTPALSVTCPRSVGRLQLELRVVRASRHRCIAHVGLLNAQSSALHHEKWGHSHPGALALLGTARLLEWRCVVFRTATTVRGSSRRTRAR